MKHEPTQSYKSAARKATKALRRLETERNARVYWGARVLAEKAAKEMKP